MKIFGLNFEKKRKAFDEKIRRKAKGSNDNCSIVFRLKTDRKMKKINNIIDSVFESDNHETYEFSFRFADNEIKLFSLARPSFQELHKSMEEP